MASISQIPFPKSGIDVFGEGMDRMFSDLMKRQQMAQERGIKREELGQANEHFLKQQAMQQQAQNRLNQMLPYQIQAWKDAHAKMDPNYEINQYKALEDWVKGQSQQGGGSQGGQQGARPYGQIGAPPQQSIPTQEMGQGMGMFSPEGMQNAQQLPPVTAPAAPQTATAGAPNIGGLNLELLKANPSLRGFAKKLLGFDPLAAVPQTPEEKQAAALDLFKEKEKIKAANKTGSAVSLTEPIKTKYQNVIGGVSSAKPILRKIISEVRKGNIPGQAIGAFFKPDAQANYKGEISTLLDGIRNAYTIPNTDSGTAKAEDKVLRKAGESDNNYADRLETILKQIEAREKDAKIKLNAGNITAGNMVYLVGPNGEEYDVPEAEVEAIIYKNPGVRRG